MWEIPVDVKEGQIAKYILAQCQAHVNKPRRLYILCIEYITSLQQTMGIDNQNSKKISKRDMLMLSYRLS